MQLVEPRIVNDQKHSRGAWATAGALSALRRLGTDTASNTSGCSATGRSPAS